MWRIYYNADNGRIKYMCQAAGAAVNTDDPYIDVENKVNINGKAIIDGAIVDDPNPVTQFVFSKPVNARF